MTLFYVWIVVFQIVRAKNPCNIKAFPTTQQPLWVTPTRCRDLHLKQFCLEDVAPAVLIILIAHIALAVRWMLIKILSVVINHHGTVIRVVSGGCYPNNTIICKTDRKIKILTVSFSYKQSLLSVTIFYFNYLM